MISGSFVGQMTGIICRDHDRRHCFELGSLVAKEIIEFMDVQSSDSEVRIDSSQEARHLDHLAMEEYLEWGAVESNKNNKQPITMAVAGLVLCPNICCL
jgi:hypothetical protein